MALAGERGLEAEGVFDDGDLVSEEGVVVVVVENFAGFGTGGGAVFFFETAETTGDGFGVVEGLGAGVSSATTP